jgi:hypothetical protein
MKEIFIGVKRNRKTHHGDDWEDQLANVTCQLQLVIMFVNHVLKAKETNPNKPLMTKCSCKFIALLSFFQYGQSYVV